MTLQAMLKEVQRMVTQEPQGKELWDILTCLRGPDSPSERGDGSGSANASAYKARRERKYKTGEVIRHMSGLFGGAARHRASDYVTLPPREEWDHYDRHVEKAAKALGLRVQIEEPPAPKRQKGKSVPVSVVIADVDGYKGEKIKANKGGEVPVEPPPPFKWKAASSPPQGVSKETIHGALYGGNVASNPYEQIQLQAMKAK